MPKNWITWVVVAVVVLFLTGVVRIGNATDRAAGHYIVW
jgi:Sec-independent protein translocase protein TatA